MNILELSFIRPWINSIDFKLIPHLKNSLWKGCDMNKYFSFEEYIRNKDTMMILNNCQMVVILK